MIAIDRRLNLRVTLPRGDGGGIFAHVTPISTEVFELYWKLISKTFTELAVDGLADAVGARVAAMALRDVGSRMVPRALPGEHQQRNPADDFLAEIRRLTQVFLPGAKGLESLMLDDAIMMQRIQQEEVKRIEGAAAFFSLIYSMRPEDLVLIAPHSFKMWHAQLESLTATELLHSLRTSMRAESSGEQATLSETSSTGSPAPASLHSSVTTSATGTPAFLTSARPVFVNGS